MCSSTFTLSLNPHIASAAILDTEAASVGDVNWLAQGTIYPDVSESAASKTGKVRSTSIPAVPAAAPWAP